MTINFACPSCNASFSAPEEYANRQAKCKSCGTMVRIPTHTAQGEQPSVSREPEPTPPHVPAEAPRNPGPPPQMAPPSAATPTPPAALHATVARTERSTPRRDPVFGRPYMHSGLARVLDVVALIVLVLAALIQLYIFSQVDWNALGKMPLDLALATVATSILPGSILALLALFTMSMAHGLEYLARVARRD